MPERVDILLALKSKLEGAESALAYLKQLAGGLGVAAVAYKALSIARESGQLAGEIKNLAAEANLTTNAFQALKLGAIGYGVTQNDIVRSATVLRKNLEDAAKDGASPLNQHLRDLGLTAAGLQALAPERQFERLGFAIGNAVDKEKAFAAAVELLGAKQAPRLLEFLRDLGKDGYDSMAKAAKGITLTKEQLDVLDQAANRWERIAAAAKIAGAHATLFGVSVAQSVGKAMQNPEARGRDPAATATQVEVLRARIAAFEQRAASNSIMRPAANDSRLLEYRRVLAILEAKLKEEQAQEAIAKSAEKAAAAERETAMNAAELKATLEGLTKQDRTLRQKVGAFDTKTLNEAIAAASKQSNEDFAAKQREAEGYKNLADPLRTYRLELEKVAVLKSQQLLTDEEAAAATKVLTQRMLEQTGEIGAHTRRLSELQEKRQLISGNPFLGADQKQSELGAILRDENRELDRQIELLRARTDLTPGQARQLDGLVQQRTENQYNPAGMSFGQQVGAGVMDWANSFGTQAQQTAGVITNTIGRAVDGVSRGIAGWITGAVSWKQMLISIGTGILEDIITSLVRIGIQQIINATIGKALQASTLATTLTTTAITGAAISAMMIAPATLATIATLGSAAALAPAEILGALALAAPMGAAFYEGGHTGPGGTVHENEWVAPAWMVDHPVYGGVINSLESARSGGRGGVLPTIPDTAAAGGSGRKERTILVIPDMVSARNLARDPEYDSTVVGAMRRNKGDLINT